jgi:calnexin
MVPNPKCEEAAGCGPWTSPKIRNPDYKGKWTIPKIANPDYKGEWAPKQIANPAFFEDSTPSDFTKIAGIGIELWTMTEDILCKLTRLLHRVRQLICSRQHLCRT